MPQEGRSRSRSRSRSRRRSVGYRTFITCEDPRGVVECETTKKPKITPAQKDEHGKKKPESERRKHKSLSLCSKEMQIGQVKEEEEECCQSPTSFHLLEVSKGAQKLNNVISSWSNAGHSRNNSTDLAQDLLKGALDLGDSLALLSRFQQSPIKKQHKQNLEMDFVEEMKNVIRNGVGSKQEETEACFDAPSTSSSQSSIVHSAPNKKNRKTKWPNLIAKLMGLEDASLRSLPYNTHPRKHMSKGEKISKQKKPAFDDGDKGDDIPPIVILRPSRFSCLDLEQPIIPKSRGDVFEEMFLGMTIRTNPLAQTDEAKPKVKTSSLGKSKHYKKQFVEKNAIEAQKLIDIRKKGWKSGNLVNKTASTANANQRYKAVTEEASQIEITVADYVVDDDQSSPSETSLQEYGKKDHVKLSHCSADNLLYPVCDHLTNGNQSPYTDKLRDLLLSSPDYNTDHSETSKRRLLDTVNELIGLHGSRCLAAILPLPWTTHKTGSVSVHSSLEKRLDEVCDEIKALRRCTKAEGDNHSADNRLVMLVKGDLRTTGMVGGMWDFGWTGSADELQQLSRDLEEILLDELIQEIFV